MCGIVGYIGTKSATDVVISGLKRLEYRGYDSAGLVVVEGGKLHTVKQSGKVRDLEQMVYGRWDEGFRTKATLGIAHTRWATHGSPTPENAHPHSDQTGRLAMVHNGIIENYAAIKGQLQAKGHVFKSQTDSEVLIHLIGELYQGNLVEAVCAALKHVEGTYGIAVVSEDHPDEFVVARKGSPLVIGLGEGETIVASDVSAIIAHTRQVVYLDDDDVAVVCASGIDIRNINNIPVSREVAKVDWDVGAAEKGGYEHFMLKEIHEQPESLRNTLRGRLDGQMGTALLSGLALGPRELAAIRRVVIVACGTSYHAGMVGKYYFEELADLPTEVDQAAEYRYRNPIIRPDDLVVAISQSGETADTLAAVREAKQKGALVVAICNVVGSTIARETGRGVYLHAGPEIGVASTKAFTCQLTVLLMMALKIGRCRRLSRQNGLEICEEIRKIPELVEAVLVRNATIRRGTSFSLGAAPCIRWRSRGRSSSRKSATSTRKATMRRNSNTGRLPCWTRRHPSWPWSMIWLARTRWSAMCRNAAPAMLRSSGLSQGATAVSRPTWTMSSMCQTVHISRLQSRRLWPCNCLPTTPPACASVRLTNLGTWPRASRWNSREIIG